MKIVILRFTAEVPATREDLTNRCRVVSVVKPLIVVLKCWLVRFTDLAVELNDHLAVANRRHRRKETMYWKWKKVN